MMSHTERLGISRKDFVKGAALVAGTVGVAVFLRASKQQPTDIIRGLIQKIVGESRMPTEGFESTMVIFGGKLTTDPQGRMVLDRRGPVSRVDIAGDYFLRTYDEHVLGNPLKLLDKFHHHWHPGWFWQLLITGPKRHRGTTEEVAGNIQRLGLANFYGPHPWGIEVKKPEVFTKGIPFQDALRVDLINSDRLKGIDRFQALAEVAKYMRTIHDRFGGIGEGVPYRFIFQKQEQGRVLDPVLFIPDIVYSPSKYDPKRFKPGSLAPALYQKATDYLEFLMSLGFEEYRRSKDWHLVNQALDKANVSYGDGQVISVTGSFAKRGRITLEHPLFSQHNRSHLGFDPTYAQEIRQKVATACQRSKKA